ncbi:DUF4783 domain-containing protein [Panacibacter sp. DH6]|uniref:DUF4783 domain-containing protein n=1 Tax=Panacibacter microcysteis TaxID=2793269 RepID=A0A931E529_9BACT|nr:DUF4783 domain-containing protein [Panacibacter microcysteis]MBG9375425.1 DUF4783 domain-containing protein [Panacibacter microcysteis]
MKRMMAIIGVAFAMSAFIVVGDIDKIINALSAGNAAQFSSFYDDFLDIKLPEKDEIKNVGKNQASITVKSFFDNNGIKGFEKTSQREMGGTMYLTGRLKGENKNFNITLLMKDRGDKLSIISIRVN